MIFVGGGLEGGELGYRRKCVLEGRGEDVRIAFFELEEGAGRPLHGVGGERGLRVLLI